MGLKKSLSNKRGSETKEKKKKMTIGYSACPTELTAQPWKVNESGAQQTNGTLRNLKLVEI
jgi:hypothetical protein